MAAESGANGGLVATTFVQATGDVVINPGAGRSIITTGAQQVTPASGTQATIAMRTLDGADNQSVRLGGGGTTAGLTDEARGAFVQASGNEEASTPGRLWLYAGNATGATIRIFAVNSTGAITFEVGAGQRWLINSSGEIEQNSSNGGSVVFTRNNTATCEVCSTGLTATGTVLADSLQLASQTNVFATVAAGTGCRLWNMAGARTGYTITVVNNGANTLNVYPPDGSGNINSKGGGTAATVNAGVVGFFRLIGTNTWRAWTSTLIP